MPAAHLQLKQGGERILTHPIAFVRLRNNELTSISTCLKCLYKGCAVGLQHACSAPAIYTEVLENSNTSHCVCEIEKLRIDIHIDIPNMHIQRVCRPPAAFLQRTFTLHRLVREFQHIPLCL